MWIPSPNLPLLHQINWGGCKPHWSTKVDEKHSCEGWLLESVLQKKAILKITQTHRKIPMLESLSNIAQSP